LTNSHWRTNSQFTVLQTAFERGPPPQNCVRDIEGHLSHLSSVRFKV
jgi:hypothetical protein